MLTDVKTAISHHSGQNALKNPNAVKERPSKNDSEEKPRDFESGDFLDEHNAYAGEVYDLVNGIKKEEWSALGMKSTQKWWDLATFQFAAWYNWMVLNKTTVAKDKAKEGGNKFAQEQKDRAAEAERKKREREANEKEDREDKKKIAKASEEVSETLGEIASAFTDLVKNINTPSPAAAGAAPIAADPRIAMLENRVSAMEKKVDDGFKDNSGKLDNLIAMLRDRN